MLAAAAAAAAVARRAVLSGALAVRRSTGAAAEAAASEEQLIVFLDVRSWLEQLGAGGGGGDGETLTLALPAALVADLQRAEPAFADGDEPGVEFVAGERAELFDLTLKGVVATKSGWVGAVDAVRVREALELRRQRGEQGPQPPQQQQQQAGPPPPVWDEYVRRLRAGGVAWPCRETGLLWGAPVIDAPAVALYTLERGGGGGGGGRVTGLVVSTEAF